MTPGEFREYVRTMHDFKISKLKMGDVEIVLDHSQAAQMPVQANPGPKVMPLGSDPDIIAHKQEELASLLKLSDNELVDQLFPEEQQEEAV